MSSLRIVVLMHKDLVPPDTLDGVAEKEMMNWKTEFDVCDTLQMIGHEIRKIGLQDDLSLLRDEIVNWEPHIVFNLLEEFHSVSLYDQHVVGYLELMKQPYTGCNPRGLLLAHDKYLSKQILTYHRIPTPHFAVFPRGKKIRRPKRLQFPLLVKSATEEASFGISQASIVSSDEKLIERIEFIHDQIKTDALVEEYVEGREFYVGVIGNHRLQTFPVWELQFTKMPDDVPHIATRKVKWDLAYQERHGIITNAADDLPPGLADKMGRISKRIYRALHLSGYARMDFRVSKDNRIYVLEANPNPNLSYGEDFAESAEAGGITYEELMQRIVNSGLRYKAPWQA
ncbi:MAG: ATP-grasp domain-containing protein [Planctomycetaceae bacterium]